MQNDAKLTDDERKKQTADIQAQLVKLDEMEKKAAAAPFRDKLAAFVEADKAGDQETLKRMIAELSGRIAPGRIDLGRSFQERVDEGSLMTIEMTEGRMRPSMPASARGDDVDIAVPQQPLGHRIRGWLLWLGVMALLAWAWSPAEMFRASSLFTDWRNMAEFGQRLPAS